MHASHKNDLIWVRKSMLEWLLVIFKLSDTKVKHWLKYIDKYLEIVVWKHNVLSCNWTRDLLTEHNVHADQVLLTEQEAKG
jgi:hypothetical protein